MVTTDKDFQSYKDNDKPCTFYGLSTDDKPTTMTVNDRVFDVVGGSAFVEIDTGGIYMYDEENQEWYQMNSGSGGGGGGGSSTLIGLTDVDISNPTNGQTLVYNATSGKWENGAGGVLAVHGTESGTTITLDKTWKEIYNSSLPILIDVYEEGGYISRTFNPIILAEHQENEAYSLLVCMLASDIGMEKWVFTTDNENGYPVFDFESLSQNP